MKKTNLKKAVIIGMCCTIISSNTTFAMDKGIDVKESIGIQFNNEWLQIDGSPFIQNERTLIPLQGFIDKLGAKFEYDLQTGKVKISADDINIEFIMGQDTAKIIKNVDGVLKEENVKLDVAAKIVNDKYYVPVRFIAEALGAKVNWDNTLRAVLIETDGSDIISVERPIDFEILEHQSIMANEYLASWYQSNFKKEGIYSIVDGDFMYVLVSAGEKPTGGYTLQINSMTEVTPGTAYIHATLKSPDEGSFVTDALTYPNSIARFNKGNIEQVQWDLDYLGNYEEVNSISYKNDDYGFNFSLPESWKNYSIVTSKWEGTLLHDNSKLEGLIINIRHPQWTLENKRQDIPIMIFTHEQWELIQNDKLGVGAAPIAPRELGHNKSYVFALPARYNYSFLTGYEEVESIIENNPLQAFEK